MRSRRAAREWALRLLYAHEMSGNPVIECFEDLLGEMRDEPNVRFCRDLCIRAAEKNSPIDALISQSVQKWDLKRIAVLDHMILRAAIAEFLYFDDIPFKVTINEAIELAKRYSTDQSGRFVNGILDAVSTELQKKIKKPADLPTGA
jgi:transcription antitermination protein NusB